MPIDYTHQHVSSSIMKVDQVHTPIDPSGGASNVPDPSGAPDGQGPRTASGSYALSNDVVITDTQPVFCDIAQNSTTVSDIGGVASPGWLVSGFGIPDGATVVSVDLGDSSAVISHAATETNSGTLRVTEPDPGAIGAGRLWSRQEGDGANIGLSLRNSTNELWIALGPCYYDANGWLAGSVILSGNSEVILAAFLRDVAASIVQVALTATGIDIERAVGNVTFGFGLPTSDPGSGGVWVNAANHNALTIGSGS